MFSRFQSPAWLIRVIPSEIIMGHLHKMLWSKFFGLFFHTFSHNLRQCWNMNISKPIKDKRLKCSLVFPNINMNVCIFEQIHFKKWLHIWAHINTKSFHCKTELVTLLECYSCISQKCKVKHEKYFLTEKFMLYWTNRLNCAT